MQLIEMFNNNLPGYRTEKDDNTPLKLSDLRKTKLTLKQLNRLRIMNDVRKLEQEKKIEDVKAQFTPPLEPNMGM
jgi:hypothetical protein